MQVFIINKNRLTTTRQLVQQLEGKADLTIIDNESSWEPLLEWYSSECPVKVVLGEDFGPRTLWTGHDDLTPEGEVYAVTDSDLDLTDCINLDKPLLPFLSEALDKYPDVMKVGVSLRLDDLPDEYPEKEFTLKRESEYWEDERDEDFYNADVATTLAVYRPGNPVQYGPALRSKPPYQARHVPWYLTPETMTDEERYYLDHADFEKWRGIVFSRRIIDRLDVLEGS